MKKIIEKNGLIIVITLIVLIIILFVFYNPFLIFKLKGSNTITLKVFEEYQEAGYEAELLNTTLTNDVIIDSNIDTKKVGEYIIKYTVNKFLTKKQLYRTIKIIDDVKPEITLNGKTDIKLCPNHEYVEEGYSAIDNYDGVVTDKVQKTISNDIISYSVFDSSNNSEVQERKITYEDNEKPEITLNSNYIYVIKNKKYIDPGYNAIDNCDGDITEKVEIKGVVDTTKYGEYKLIYSIKDSFNNENSTKRLVSVVDYIYDNSTKYPAGNGYNGVIIGPTLIKGILIVNKKYSLPSSYNPGLNSEAVNNLNNLKNDASKNGHTIKTVSGYRSYESQKTIYNRNIKNRGYAKTDYVSARPGHSEHQSGLSFDVGELDYNYGETEAGKWLKNNCHNYGFIIRYPKNKKNITGYDYEPWHIRYVGKTAATEIMKKNITLEEYLEIA